MKVADVIERAAAYGIPGAVVDGMDAVAVYEAAAIAVERARAGEGPSMVEAKTYRYYNHHGIQDLGQSYRTDEEVLEWKARDAIAALEARMAESGVLDAAGARAVWDEVGEAIAAAIEFAEESPYPDPSTMLDDVYTEKEVAR